MPMCLKDWLDTEVRNHNHSNLYDISEYDTSIFFTKTTLFFSDFSYIFLQFCLNFVEFICATSVDMC
jgi:hypothetical protein